MGKKDDTRDNKNEGLSVRIGGLMCDSMIFFIKVTIHPFSRYMENVMSKLNH